MKNILKNISTSLKEYEKEEIIFFEDEVCHFIGFVLEGKVKISSYTSFGNEVIYSIIQEGEFFGNNLLFSSSSTYKGNVICLEKCKICLFTKEQFLSFLTSDSSILEKYLSSLAEKSIIQNETIKLLSFESAEERFLYYLSTHQNEISFDSITSLSQTLFLRRETLSRLIKKLIQNQSIIKENKRIKKIEC